ncbi:MAG: SsrA-binding protein SmpB [Opitutales bacterium]|nr:SsrA-binding protein SmpB [Opitutales bacterium]
MTSKTHEKTKTFLNRKLSHEFFIGKRFEAGIVLLGTEIKSLRNGNGDLEKSFIHLDRYHRLVWINAYIHPYSFGTNCNHEPTRSRLLLLHRREINELRGALERKGESVFPTKLYFQHGLAKLEIAICKAKKLYDKRYDLKKRAEQRDLERTFRTHLSSSM